MKFVVWSYDIFENNAQIMFELRNYWEDYCRLDSHQYLSFKNLPRDPFVREIYQQNRAFFADYKHEQVNPLCL